MNRFFSLALMSFGAMTASGQNITDLSVAGDKSASEQVLLQEDKALDQSVFLCPDRIKYDSRCFQIEGEDCFIYSGTFHYFRVLQPLWEDRMKKIKEAGLNCVETYVPWNWHEREMPKNENDYTKINLDEFEAFLQLAEKYGLYVIVRPGPYICAEWSGGGFPQWLMRKKPAKTAYECWLQSDDEEFMKWNNHWYNAVCRVVKPHLISQRDKGKGGVILFQIENEFNRIKWFPKEVKTHYLSLLAKLVRDNGIDVPIITCWTNETRNSNDPNLNGVLDMVNSYPRWDVEKNFGRLINQQLKSQPGKPLLSGELQGGWMSEVGGQMSWEQPGLTPAQTQNVTLYALQRGFCGLNYYMMVGGSNFDDWGARQMTQTYDYAAAIGENGETNDRYRRIRGLAPFLKEHGTQIARSNIMKINYSSTDSTVELTLRQASNGDRYYFIRTEEHTASHHGTIRTDNFAIDFSLEPFGSMVYYIPAGKQTGEWYPKLPEPECRIVTGNEKIELKPIASNGQTIPKKWKKLKQGQHLDELGIYGRHAVYYRTKARMGCELTVGLVGEKLVNGSIGDDLTIMVDGKVLSPTKRTATSYSFALPGDSMSNKYTEVILLYESAGLHHHTNKAVEKNWGIGIDYAESNGQQLPLKFAYTEAESPLLSWYRYSFSLPTSFSYPLYFRLRQQGNGYIYLNGRCLGRCDERGPQTDYWLPECWLNKDGENTIVIKLHQSSEKTVQIIECSINNIYICAKNGKDE